VLLFPLGGEIARIARNRCERCSTRRPEAIEHDLTMLLVNQSGCIGLEQQVSRGLEGTLLCLSEQIGEAVDTSARAVGFHDQGNIPGELTPGRYFPKTKLRDQIYK